MDGWIDEWIDRWMDVHVSERTIMHRRMNGWMHVSKDYLKDGWMDGWVTEGEMFTSISEALSSSFSSDNGEGTLAITSLRGCPFRLISCKRSTIAL